MEILKAQNDANTVLRLTGRLDTITAPQLQTVLTEALKTAQGLELDFSKIDYVSSAGLRVLLLCEKKAKSAGKIMTLTNVSSEVMEVFEITGFSGILTFNSGGK